MNTILIKISLLAISAVSSQSMLMAQDTTDSIVYSTEQSYGKIWTMEDCMAYAAENAPDVVKARWDLASANASQSQSLAEFFPSVSAQASGQVSWGRNIDPETNTYGNVSTFGNSYGIYASWTLFDGGRTFNSYKLARTQRARSLNTIQMKRDDRAIATMMAYVDAVYYEGAIKIAADRLEQSRKVLALTNLQEELGIKGYPDVAEAESTVAGDEYNLVQQRNLYQQSMLKLRSTMNFPKDEALRLDTLTAASHLPEEHADNAAYVYAMALTSNPTAIDAEFNVREQQNRYSVEKGRIFPTISFNAGISTSYFKNLTGDYATRRFGDQFRNNLGEYVSVSISIPIFTNLSIWSGVRRSKYALNRAKIEKEEQLRQLYDDISLAVADRDGYAAEVSSMKAKTEADKKAYELNSRKYEEGMLSIIDRQLSANTYYTSRLTLLQKQMLYILKYKLVDYYKGNQSWMSR